MWKSIELQRSFSEKMVKMARTNANHFESFDDEGAADIANHKIIMTEENGPCYVFK